MQYGIILQPFINLLGNNIVSRHFPGYCVIVGILCTSSCHQSWAFKEVFDGFSHLLSFIWCQSPKCVWWNSMLLLILWCCIYTEWYIGHMCRRNWIPSEIRSRVYTELSWECTVFNVCLRKWRRYQRYRNVIWDLWDCYCD